MNSTIKSAADPAYEDTKISGLNMNVDIGDQAKAPHINTVSNETYEAPSSGQQAEPTVKSRSLPDSDQPQIKSAAG